MQDDQELIEVLANTKAKAKEATGGVWPMLGGD